MLDKEAFQQKDKAPIGPETPSYLVHPMVTSVPSCEIADCRVKILIRCDSLWLSPLLTAGREQNQAVFTIIALISILGVSCYHS